MTNILKQSRQQQQPGAGSAKARDGMSWEGQAMPPSAFSTVVAPPTIQVSGSEGHGAIPTVEEFRQAMGREPDKYEMPQMTGLMPFNGTCGYEIFDFKTNETRQTAMHLSIPPERRKDVLLRLPREDRGDYLAIWTLLDFDQQLGIEDARALLESDETLAAISELDVVDARLAEVGGYGIIQDGMVKPSRSQDKPLGKGVPITAFFAAKKVDGQSDAVQVKQVEKPAKVVAKNEEDDEMKKPTQCMDIRYKIAGSTMKRKCAYVKVNEVAMAMLVAYAEGADSDEFDEGTEVSVMLEGRTFKCEAGPVFDIAEAMVTCQVFRIKE